MVLSRKGASYLGFITTSCHKHFMKKIICNLCVYVFLCIYTHINTERDRESKLSKMLTVGKFWRRVFWNSFTFTTLGLTTFSELNIISK